MQNNDINDNSNYEKSKIDKLITHNNSNLNFDILSNDYLCIICWEIDGNIILCLNCKFKYCDNCVKKVDSKCCICFRNKNYHNNLHNYDNFYSDDFEISHNAYFFTYTQKINYLHPKKLNFLIFYIFYIFIIYMYSFEIKSFRFI